MNRDSGYSDYGDTDDLEEIAEMIQVGDREEGAQALGKLLKKAGGNTGDVAGQVRRQMAMEQIDREIQNGIKDLEERNPGIAKSHILGQAAMAALRAEVGEDLRAEGIPEDQVKRISSSDELALKAYKELRILGKSRKFEDIGEATARRMRQEGVAVRTAKSRTPESVVRAQVEESRARRRLNDSFDDGDRSPIEPTAAEKAQRQRGIDYINQRRQRMGLNTVELRERGETGRVNRHIR
jgi:hypothetical protein